MAGAMFESEERGLPLFRRGKVRDVYQPSDEHLLIVACDRISAFDSVLPTPIPDKGRILTQISNFWFEKTAHIIPNHIVDPNPGPQWYPDIDWYYPDLDGRTVLVRSTQPLVIEAIVRGYLSGSGWKEYQKPGTVCAIRLPEGLTRVGASAGAHLHPVHQGRSGPRREHPVREGGCADRRRSGRARCATPAWPSTSSRRRTRWSGASSSPTPSSSSGSCDCAASSSSSTRCSPPTPPASGRPTTTSPGRAQASYDKQYVRDYLESIKWNKEPPAPALPAEVVGKTREKYWEAMRRLVS